MRLVMFDDGRGARLGALLGGAIADLASASQHADIVSVCCSGRRAIAELESVAATAKKIEIGAARLLAPIGRPVRNIFCVGKNYHEHASEFHASGFDATSTTAIPDVPIIFTKAPSSVIGPGDQIPSWLDETNSVDYEGELTLVIGAGGRGVSKAAALDHIFGYTIINDVTARTLQGAHKQWFLGKSLDGFCPMGPCVVTADEIPDTTKLHLITRVNGEVRQNAKLTDLIFDIPTLVETISKRITLEPGDLIATGTPAGVGIGFKPPRYLKKGDVVDITVEPIGTLSNPVG